VKDDLSNDDKGSGLVPNREGREADVSVPSRGEEGNDWDWGAGASGAGGGLMGITGDTTDGLDVSGVSLNMLPQTSSSQPFELSMTVSGFILELLRPTSVSKFTPESKFGNATPFAGVDRSSMRCESRKNWLCSFSTLSPSLRMTVINR